MNAPVGAAVVVAVSIGRHDFECDFLSSMNALEELTEGFGSECECVGSILRGRERGFNELRGLDVEGVGFSDSESR